ncbi:hypothetical protein SO802_022916 [Lithocarpus litseifolius]|uniref:Uncharacterized protein n=1 Tax=Lithocarpus litseifolius TaxID=425828 RepID=A0AAW2C6P5_9ROSI
MNLRPGTKPRRDVDALSLSNRSSSNARSTIISKSSSESEKKNLINNQAHRHLRLKLNNSNSNNNKAHQAIGDSKIRLEIRERDCVGGWRRATATALPLVLEHINISKGEIGSKIALAWPQVPDVLPQRRPSRPSLLSTIHIKNRTIQSSRSAASIVFAAQSNFLKVIQTVWKVGKDGVEAGTNLVPDSVPRPIARISVTLVALTVSLFVLKSFLSTAFFALATMGLIYFAFIAMNKDDGPKWGGGGPKGGGGTTSTEDSLEEAKRIMEKYK